MRVVVLEEEQARLILLPAPDVKLFLFVRVADDLPSQTADKRFPQFLCSQGYFHTKECPGPDQW